MLKNQDTLLKQKKPLSSVLGDDIGRFSEYHGDNKIVLTPETIQAILSQNVPVNRAHSENVPHKMSEKEFWTFYVKSKFFQGNRRQSETPNPLDEYYEDASEDNVETTGTMPISRLVDITATAEDHTSDIITRTTEHLRSQKDVESLSLIRKFNHHSLRIVQATAGSMPPLQISDAIELEDLKADSPEMATPLDVDTERISYRSNAPVQTKVDPSFVKEMSNIKLDVLSFVKSNLKNFEERKGLLLPYNSMIRDEKESNDTLHTPIGDDVLLFHNNAAEVLRHFWASYPPGKNTVKQTKITRMTTILEQLELKGREIIKSKPTLPEQARIESALIGISVAIEHAIAKQNPDSKRPRLDDKGSG